MGRQGESSTGGGKRGGAPTAASAAAAAAGVSETVLRKVMLSYAYVGIWIFLSFTVIVYNKYILDPKMYNWPFPISLTMALPLMDLGINQTVGIDQGILMVNRFVEEGGVSMILDVVKMTVGRDLALMLVGVQAGEEEEVGEVEVPGKGGEGGMIIMVPHILFVMVMIPHLVGRMIKEVLVKVIFQGMLCLVGRMIRETIGIGKTSLLVTIHQV